MEIGKNIFWFNNNTWQTKDASCWTSIIDKSNFPICKWFCNGMTNASYNELDKHLFDNKGHKICFIDSQRSINIRNFHGLVISYSKYLRLKYKRGDRLLINLPNSINTAAFITACKRNAIIYSCVAFGAPFDIVDKRLNDLKALSLIDCDLLNEISHKIIISEYKHLSDRDYVELMQKETPIEIVESNFPLFVAYTSGSTGSSKGIVHTHGGYTAGIKTTMMHVFDTKDDDIIFTIGSFGWITGQSYMLSGPMQCGITSILLDGNIMTNPYKFAEIIQTYKVTILKCGSTFLRQLMTKQSIKKELSQYDFSSLKIASFCAEPVNAEVHHFASENICTNFVNSYWATEHGGIVWSHCYSDINSNNPTTTKNKPLPWIEATVMNLDDNTECEIGEQGDILITKPYPYMMFTVWGDPENVCNPNWVGDLQKFKTYFNGNSFKQGDFAKKHHNNFYSFHGRSDEVLNISGNRIGIEEIENAILKCDGVQNAVVIGIKDEISGQIPLPFIIHTSAIDFLQIKNNIKNVLGSAFIPQEYISVPDLPKTFTGKFSRKLLNLLLSNKPIDILLPSISNPECIDDITKHIENWQSNDQIIKTQPTQPTQPTLISHNEEVIIKQIRSIASKFSIYDISVPWMDAGLNSITMLRFAEQIQETFKDFVQLTPTVLFDYPNLDKLVQKILGNEKLSHPNYARQDTFAIIGTSCHFPGNASNPQQFWDFLTSKGDAMNTISAFNLQDYPDIYVNKAAYSSKFNFDPHLFNISEQESLLMDPRHQLLLIQNYEAILQAGYTKDDLLDSNTGVFVGIDANENTEVSRYTAYTATGRAGSIASNRISFVFGLTGPSMSIDTACSSSLVALDIACKFLSFEDCDKALVSSANILSKPDMFRATCAAKMLSPNGRCATFSNQADGYSRGEGAAAILIKPHTSTMKEPVYGLIKATSIVQDGKTANLTSPNGPSQEAMLYNALQKASLKQNDITYIESHGTGTKLGDPIEINALASIFNSRDTPLFIGALKSNIGHLEPAAGVAGLIKTILILQKRKIPPNIHCDAINPLIQNHTDKFIFPKEVIDIQTESSIYAGVSSFGFGGTNAHVILQSPPKNNNLLWNTNLVSSNLYLKRYDNLKIRVMAKIITDDLQVVKEICCKKLTAEIYLLESLDNWTYVQNIIEKWTDTQNYIITRNDNLKNLITKMKLSPAFPTILDPGNFLSQFQKSFATKSTILSEPIEIPAQIDCLVIGAGIAGMLTAKKLSDSGFKVLVFEKEDYIGGIWYTQANTTSRVNSSEGAYRLLTKSKTNIDHTPTHQIMQDLSSIAKHDLNQKIKTNIEVLNIHESKNNDFNISYNFQNEICNIQAQKVFVCINRRLGNLRTVSYPGEDVFKGDICYGVSNQINSIDFRNKKVLIIGSGAFAIEHVRTAIELGATKVTVLSRQRGTVCPLVIDYLNFIRPYDKYFAHNKNGNTAIFQEWKNAFSDLGVTPPECWKEGKMTPHGHTISVSDIWLVAHYYRILTTKLGEIEQVFADHVITTNNEKVPCDIIIKCTGFEKNQQVRKICNNDCIYTNSVVSQNLVYLAENILDDVGGYQSPFGSSYLEAVKISLVQFIHDMKYNGNILPYGEKVDIVDFPISKNTQMLQNILKDANKTTITNELYEHVVARTADYHKRFLPSEFLEENKNEWNRLCALLESRVTDKIPKPDYPFANIFNSIYSEWNNADLLVGNINSFDKYPSLKASLSEWTNTIKEYQDNLRDTSENKPNVMVSTISSSESTNLQLDTIKSLLKSSNILQDVKNMFKMQIKTFLCKLIGNSPDDYDDNEPLSLYGLDSLSIIELLDFVNLKIDDVDIDSLTIDDIVDLFR